jgi:hypothetical protein
VCGIGVECSGFRVQGFRFGSWYLGVQGFRLGVWDLGFIVWGLVFRVQGLRLRV